MPEANKTESHPSGRGLIHPHGTPQRYFYEVKRGETCEACRKAANAYAKAKRAARLKAAGKPDATQRRATKTELVKRTGRPAVDLEGTVLRLRADLAEAEQAYLAHVRKLLPGLV